jgi:hypothetical protein
MKRLLKKWKTLLKITDEHLTIITDTNNVQPPINNGMRRKYCSCGGIIINSGQFVIRELCCECGKPYHEFIRKI